jgi:hypothetical protein
MELTDWISTTQPSGKLKVPDNVISRFGCGIFSARTGVWGCTSASSRSISASSFFACFSAFYLGGPLFRSLIFPAVGRLLGGLLLPGGQFQTRGDV